MSTMSAFKPFKPIVWREEEIIEGAKYRVPSKIPADIEMKRELKLRDKFKKDNPERPASEFAVWYEYELDEKTKQVAMWEDVFVAVDPDKPVSYLMSELSASELEQVTTSFFPELSKKRRGRSQSTQTSGDLTTAPEAVTAS